MKNLANFCISLSKLAVSSMSKQKVTGVISDRLTLLVLRELTIKKKVSYIAIDGKIFNEFIFSGNFRVEFKMINKLFASKLIRKPVILVSSKSLLPFEVK